MSPGMEGSRSGGLIASTWASMVSLGREGYREHAREIFETAAAMMDVVRSHPELRIMGEGTRAPTFCFSFTSDEFDIYHLVDFLGPKGWRFNGQQYPNAIHMAVTRPQTRAGVVETFAADLAEAVDYAKEQAGQPARRPSPAPIYGGVAGGLDQATERLHRRRHGRHARQAAGPASRMTDTAGDLVLAVDLGTGGPKVGLVSVRGEIALVGAHARCRRTAGPGGDADPGRRAVVAR